MGFDLGHGRVLDDAPGVVGVSAREYPPLPDDAIHNHAAGLLDPREWFDDPTRPLELEIGCGKGTFLLEQSARAKETNFVGIEWAREFYLYTADRVRRAGRSNVRMLHADAGEFLRWRCAPGVLRTIHLYFSDPWPKRKHHKNRVVQDRFLAEAWRTLEPGGELRIVTDHDELWRWNLDHISRWTAPGAPRDARTTQPQIMPDPPFSMLPFQPPEWVGEGRAVGTNYERKMCVDRPPHSCVLRKRVRA